MARALHQSENFAWLNSKDKRRGAELILKETAMDLLDSIYTLLKETGKPMKPMEIATSLLQSGLWETHGKTPGATVGARIYMDIKQKGTSSRFVKIGKGQFSLSESHVPQDLQSQPKIVKNKMGKNSSIKAGNTYSFTDCAEKVLLGQGRHIPMHYSAITRVALDKKWLATAGKTPEATMYAQIIQEIRRFRKRGEIPRFVQCGKGMVALSAWDKSGVRLQIEQHRKDVRKKLLSRMMAMDPKDFEKLVSLLFVQMGFLNVEVTPYSNDKGVDVRGKKVTFGTSGNRVYTTEYAIQVKRWSNNIQRPTIQNIRGSKGEHEIGCVVTTSSFSPGAIEEANRSDREPIVLIDKEALLDLMLEYRVGVRTEPVTLFEVRDNLLDDSEENTTE